MLIATRNATLDPRQADLLRHIADASEGKPVVQVAMRRPYDGAVEPRIGTVLLTYGDQPDTVGALVDVLLGDASAEGRCPVQLPAYGAMEVAR